MVYRPFRRPQSARECINIKARVTYRRQEIRSSAWRSNSKWRPVKLGTEK